MCRFVTCVHLCIQEDSGHWKNTVYKKWNAAETIKDINKLYVLKLILITVNKILFVFIISSLFLPHSVETVNRSWK